MSAADDVTLHKDDPRHLMQLPLLLMPSVDATGSTTTAAAAVESDDGGMCA